MASFPTLHTSRLDLVQIKESHAQDLFELFTDARVTEYYHVVPLNEPADLFPVISMFAARYNDGTGIRWGITLKGDTHVIGTIGYNSYIQGHKGTISYALQHANWNKGYIKEAIKAVMQYGRDELGLNRIDAQVRPGNTASESALKANGFIYEGLLRQWLFWDGQYFDTQLFASIK